MMAPFTPFISEEIFHNLTGEKSVHLELFDEVNESLINKNLEEKMNIVRSLVALGRSSREKVGIKVRQPLLEIIVDGKYKEKIGDLTDLIKDELNVKDVIFEENISEFMNIELKPNFKEVGKILGKNIKKLQDLINNSDSKDLLEKTRKGEAVLDLGEEKINLTEDFLDVRVSAKEGYDVSMENNIFLILETKLTKELIDEGFAREFISKVQNIRKSSGFEVIDRIEIEYSSSEKVKSAIDSFIETIKDEVLADKIEFSENSFDREEDLNGEKITIDVTRKINI